MLWGRDAMTCSLCSKPTERLWLALCHLKGSGGLLCLQGLSEGSVSVTFDPLL